MTTRCLALVAEQDGDFAAMAKHFESAVTLAAEFEGPDGGPQTALSLVPLARARVKLRDAKGAITMLQRVKKMRIDTALLTEALVLMIEAREASGNPCDDVEIGTILFFACC